MNLGKSIVTLYNKYKKQIALLVVLFFGYKFIMRVLEIKEGYSGYSSKTQCSIYNNCADCVTNFDGGSTSPCYWSNDKDQTGKIKGCSVHNDPGYYRTCSDPKPDPAKCDAISDCKTCTESNCFWGDSDQKCSADFKTGYGKICSGSNPNCPKCQECPKLTMLKIPTFITAQ
jgi:hypothetical protein